MTSPENGHSRETNSGAPALREALEGVISGKFFGWRITRWNNNLSKIWTSYEFTVVVEGKTPVGSLSDSRNNNTIWELLSEQDANHLIADYESARERFGGDDFLARQGTAFYDNADPVSWYFKGDYA